MEGLQSWNNIIEEVSVAMNKARLFDEFVTPELDSDGNWALRKRLRLCDLCKIYPCKSCEENKYPDSCAEFTMDKTMTPEYVCNVLNSVVVEPNVKKDTETTLTKEDFGIYDSDEGDELFSQILEKVRELGLSDEDAKDFHFEDSEVAMFNWIHDDRHERPVEIWWSRWPDEMENCLITDSGLWFWYV